jgi:hypothetical protein
MRIAFYASAIALLGLAAVPVQAMTIAPLSGAAPEITLVSGGCGGGFHRAPNGRCYPNGGPVVVGAPRSYFYYGGRRCWWRAPGVRVCN